MSRAAGHDPPHCKLKQMSDEGKGLVLRNGGALRGERCEAAPALAHIPCSSRHHVTAEGFEEIRFNVAKFA